MPSLCRFLVAPLVVLLIAIAGSAASASIRSGNNNNSNNKKKTSGDRQHEKPQDDANAKKRCLLQSDHPDRMTSFPGWDAPLPSAWYSGYLDYELEGQMVHTHYVFVQAEDHEGTDDDLPVIYWSNGGPGASSLFGLLTEIGPLMLSDKSLETEAYQKTGIPTPIYNPYSWTRLGSILMIDQPAPVGFSYCNDDDHDDDHDHDVANATSHSCGDISWTDELASLNAYTALQTFYKTKFPCLTEQELYLTGESYGGIYIPTLARRIVEGNERAETDESIVALALEGFAVGDGCLGTQTSMCGELGSGADGGGGFVDYWHLWFMAGHHQIPLSDFRMVMKACKHSEDAGFLTTPHSKDDEICRAAVARVKDELGGFFEYALYDECTYENGLKWKRTLGLGPGPDNGGGSSSTSSTNTKNTNNNVLGGALNDYPCGAGPVLEQYLKLGPVVSDAFHVRSTFFEVDNAVGFDYTPTEPDLQPFYKDMNGRLKILVYNGDTDPAITSFAAQNWTSHLGFEPIGHWRPWTSDGCQKMGGYVERYEGSFDFLTIRGAGHMVPTYKPEATFAFLEAWLKDEDYPAFDKNCTQPQPQPKPQPPTPLSRSGSATGSATSTSTSKSTGALVDAEIDVDVEIEVEVEVQ
eukprot:CAMPEP_0172389194 /NCGR_PEP_ID=MMETSP1061-20121228/6161_1 /TAXON_ID=37318 /ORGANISM="Pseudo-nitzschia pungens, Strain cf. pungens" /LENGTH=636 /DNA_ID=CAMNT_0013119301 /DNA_START=333 /DNA_END=2243 /DNA_ORIENTATION=+